MPCGRTVDGRFLVDGIEVSEDVFRLWLAEVCEPFRQASPDAPGFGVRQIAEYARLRSTSRGLTLKRFAKHMLTLLDGREKIRACTKVVHNMI